MASPPETGPRGRSIRSTLGFVFVALAVLVAGCAIPTRRARLSDSEPTDPIEVRAQVATDDPECLPEFGFLVPGVGQLCHGDRAEGMALLGLTGVEMTGTALVFQQTELRLSPNSPQLFPLLGLQNLWTYAGLDILRERHLARELRYVPRENLRELVAAPFNLEVLKQPSVWAGILGTVGLALGTTYLTSGDSLEVGLRTDRTFFGGEFRPGLTYGLAGTTAAVAFSHVAIGEEMAFRGFLQSTLARHFGETAGWLSASAIFGLVHASNVIALPPDQRAEFLGYGLPVILASSTYLGATYKLNDYALSAPVATHFWYNFLLSAAQFAFTDARTPIGTSLSISF